MRKIFPIYYQSHTYTESVHALTEQHPYHHMARKPRCLSYIDSLTLAIIFMLTVDINFRESASGNRLLFGYSHYFGNACV